MLTLCTQMCSVRGSGQNEAAGKRQHGPTLTGHYLRRRGDEKCGMNRMHLRGQGPQSCSLL